MEVGSVASAMALRFPKSPAGPRLLSPWVKVVRHAPSRSRLCGLPSSVSSSSSSVSRGVVRASMGSHFAADDENMEAFRESLGEVEVCEASPLTSEHKALLALLFSVGFVLGSAEAAMALGPEGPLVEEFWDNMRRYGLYFLTVFTGGLYSLLQPIFSLLRNPFTAILTIAFLSGTFYLLFLLLNTMLGITTFKYDFA